VIVTCRDNRNDFVVTVNVPLTLPAGTRMLAGTLARRLLLVLSETTAPPAGAGPFRRTVPVAGVPPLTVVGFNVSEDSAAGAIDNTVLLLTAL
jgi:hypothetical protein